MRDSTVYGVSKLSSLRVKQTKAKLTDMFASYLDTSDLSPNDEQRDNKILSRCLAAFAVYSISGCSEQDAAAAVWDGTDDNGIDAAFVDVSEAKVLLVQSKWIQAGSGEPSASDISLFADGVRDVVEQAQSRFASRLWGKLADIGQALNSPGTTIEVVLISTGASALAKQGTAKLDLIVENLNGNEFDDPLVSKKIMGLSEVYSFLATESTSENVSVDATILDWSFISHPYAAYFGVIDGLQLKEWWVTLGKRLVAKNIRHALGATDVNSQIKATALSAPENFWYFNNGITLIADEAIKAPKGAASRSSGNFQFRGASVVNGAQTLSTLGRIELDEPLGKVRVPIRVILLKNAPAEFGQQVTRTNNLQNRVESRDFVAQDSQQARIQMEMAIEGIDYQYLRSGEFVPSQTSCDLIEVTTALACANVEPNYAVQVKTGIGRFFNDLSKAPYKAIFNPSLSGAKAFNTTLTQRVIDAWIDAKKKSTKPKNGPLWGALVHGNRVLAAAVYLKLGENYFSLPIVEFQTQLNVDTVRIGSLCQEVYDRMIGKISSDYQGKFLAILFKNPTDSKKILDSCA